MEEASPTKHSDNDKQQYEYYLDVTLNEFTNKEDYDNRHSIIIGYLLSLANTEVSSVPKQKSIRFIPLAYVAKSVDPIA